MKGKWHFGRCPACESEMVKEKVCSAGGNQCCKEMWACTKCGCTREF